MAHTAISSHLMKCAVCVEQLPATDPGSQVYMNHKSILPTFTHLNLLLQREDPNIYLVADAIRSFFKKLLSKFIKLPVIRNADDKILVKKTTS